MTTYCAEAEKFREIAQEMDHILEESWKEARVFNPCGEKRKLELIDLQKTSRHSSKGERGSF